MSRRTNCPSHLRLVVDNGQPRASDDEDAALEALCHAQARWLKTGSKEDAEAAETALRAVMVTTGGDPDAAMPLHRWRYR